MNIKQRRHNRLVLLVSGFLGLWGGYLIAFPPQPLQKEGANLESMLPNHFGNWIRLDNQNMLADEVVSADESKTANQVAEAVYFSGNNQRIMLSLSYGRNQLDTRFNAHRPEYCYQAQGFSLSSNTDRPITVGQQTLMVRDLSMHKYDRHENITYWMTMDQQPVLPGLPRFLVQVKKGLLGVIPDGYLVRISTLTIGRDDQSHAHDVFANDWIRSLSSTQQRELIGD